MYRMAFGDMDQSKDAPIIIQETLKLRQTTLKEMTVTRFKQDTTEILERLCSPL
jgi:hypothetical protein